MTHDTVIAWRAPARGFGNRAPMPEKLFVLVGTNDLSVGTSIAGNFEALVDRVLAVVPTCTIHLQGA